MIFEAKCMKCGKRKGIELPDNNFNTMIALNMANSIQANQNCLCGGFVEIFTYKGRLDKDRVIHED